ncbi:MAG: IS3 family transposase [Chloroflexi bacterium]|nr:IS3 family transposase [Chloroflexota bacterium]
MSSERKVELADGARRAFGLTSALAALELPRSTWHYHQSRRRSYTEKYADLRAPLEAIARRHPEYGYRRTTPELRERTGRRINRKVVQRLHRAWGLPLIRGTRTPKPSGIRRAITAAGNRINLVAGRQEIRPMEVAYTDFTELIYAGGRRKAYLIPIVDHASKIALGWAVGDRAVTSLALEAWEQAKRGLRARRMHVSTVTIHHDQDPVFTSYAWTARLLLKDQAHVSYALNGAQDNTEMEAFNSRFKTENRSLVLDARSLTELKQLVAERMVYYNNVRRHSSIGYRAPSQYIATLQPWT